MTLPKILVFTPLHPDYGVQQHTLDSINAALQAYQGPVDWHLCANDNPHVLPFENVTRQHNKARQLVLDGGYDILLSIEADMIVPPDTITKLTTIDADVVYGLYVWRHQKHRWSAYKELTLWGGESYSYDFTGISARSAWGKIVDAAGLGMGCTMIRRTVLERLSFRLYDGEPGWIEDVYGDQFREMGIDPRRQHKGMLCDDWFFALDVQHYNFSQKADLSVVCGHITEKGVLWPDVDVKELYRLEVA